MLMKAVIHSRYGNPEVLQVATLERPVPRKNEVLVRVMAAGLDYGQWHLMSGKPYVMRLATGLTKPKQRVLGKDLSGVVEAVGAAVTPFKVGDAVFGAASRTFAEFTCAREDQLCLKPERSSFEEAAATAVSGVTALIAVRDVAKIKPGQSLCLIGAGGGVGSWAVQLARHFGARVTAVCSTSKVELVRSLGATDVIDYSAQDVTTTDGRFDVVLDIAGGQPLSRLRRLIDGRGTLVVVGAEDNGNLIGMRRQLLAVLTSPFVRQRLRMMVSNENSADLERLVELIERGDLTPSVGHAVPLDQAADAMALLVRGEARGKIAIAVQPASVSTPPAEVSSRVV